jgi:hypothetical protein
MNVDVVDRTFVLGWKMLGEGIPSLVEMVVSVEDGKVEPPRCAGHEYLRGRAKSS